MAKKQVVRLTFQERLNNIKLLKRDSSRVDELVLRHAWSEEQAIWFVKMHKLLNDNDGTMDGRWLWDVLEVDEAFTQWIQRQLENIDAIEDKDFFRLNGKTSEQGGRPTNEYTLTTECAKHICMTVGVTPRTNANTKANSKQVRDYFILAEKLAFDERSWNSVRKDAKQLKKDMDSAYFEAYIDKHKRKPDSENFAKVQDDLYVIVFDMHTKEIKHLLGLKQSDPIPSWVLEKHNEAICFVYMKLIGLFEMGIIEQDVYRDAVVKSFDKKFGGVIEI